MIERFYQTFGQVSFTLLGLWMAVAGVRYARWASEPVHRRMAYAVFLHFALPGLMSVFALVDPEGQALWRVTFSVAAALGAVGLWLLRVAPSDAMKRSNLVSMATAAGVVLYVAIAVVALLPTDVVADALGVDPLQVEGGLLTLMAFLGANLGWMLLGDVEPAPPRPLGPS